MQTSRRSIVRLSAIDYITLLSLLLACIGLILVLRGMLALAISVMLVALITDMLDGAIARHLQRESGYGQSLDSFVDVFVFLLLPTSIFYRMGMHDGLSLLSLFIFITAGVMRLAHFNQEGIQTDDRGMHYLGLPVFWSHLLTVLGYGAWSAFGTPARFVIAAAMLVMAGLMVWHRPFGKPRAYVRLGLLILSVAALFAYLHVSGQPVP